MSRSKAPAYYNIKNPEDYTSIDTLKAVYQDEYFNSKQKQVPNFQLNDKVTNIREFLLNKLKLKKLQKAVETHTIIEEETPKVSHLLSAYFYCITFDIS